MIIKSLFEATNRRIFFTINVENAKDNLCEWTKKKKKLTKKNQTLQIKKANLHLNGVTIGKTIVTDI